MVALLSPPGATHDEWYHASSIWCGHGIRAPYCTEKIESQAVAITNLDAVNCQGLAESVLYCPTARTGQSNPVTNFGFYPRLFYFVLSWVVVPSADFSIFLARATSALIITVLLGFSVWLLPSRHRTVLILVILTTFSATGYFLFASINPSSWTAAGVGVGWLSMHAAGVSPQLSRSTRWGLVCVGALAALMAAGSRYDAYAFLAFSASLTCLHVLWLRLPSYRRRSLMVGLGGSVLLLGLLEGFTPISPLDYARLLYTFNDGQPDNITFFSNNLLEGLPNSLLALGTVPTMAQVVLPSMVYISAISVLSFFLIRTFKSQNKLQLSGFFLTAVMIAVTIAAQVATNDSRDQGMIEPRYSYPLLIFIAGWWYLNGPEDLYSQVSRYLRPAAVVITISFFLTMFTVAERFIDRQTFGLRYLPEGPDQWWWTWLPVGPNALVVLATCCLWMSLRHLISFQGESARKQVHQ